MATTRDREADLVGVSSPEALEFRRLLFPRVDGAELQACYRSAGTEERTGGDWYDVFRLEGGRLAFSVGDVFGHGVDTAAAMVRIRETLRTIGGIDADPGAALRIANQALHNMHPGVLASALFGTYDSSSRHVEMAVAGHPPPALVCGGRATLLPIDGIVLGASATSAYSTRELFLQSGDSFVLYTGGLIEQERDPMDGEEKLLALLADGTLNAESLVELLAGDAPRDDVAVLILSIR